MLTRKDNVKVGDRVVVELDTKEGLFATAFRVDKVHGNGSLTVTSDRCYRNGVEGSLVSPQTFRSYRSAFDYVTEVL